MINKLRAFNYVFWKSISSFAYYRDVVKSKFSFSLKYFLAFSCFLAIIMTVTLSATVVPFLSGMVSRFDKRAPNLFPQDLVVTIKNGEASTNVTEPFHMPIPYELFTDTPGAITDQQQKYLLTIDTAAEASDYDSYQSFVLLTKDALVFPDRGGFRVQPLTDMSDITISKESYDAMIQVASPFIHSAVIAAPIIFIIIFFFLVPFFRLVGLLFSSILVFIGAKVMGVNLGYGKVYQIGLHSMTLPTLLELVMTSFGLVPPIPFFTTIVFFLYSLVILAELRKVKSLAAKK